jgi:hypothetical protein
VSAAQDRTYFIQHKSRTHGPCTLAEIASYVAYGSLAATDLVWDQAADSWLAVKELLTEERVGSDESGVPRAANTGPRRVVRYRDYHKVPHGERAGELLTDMLWGMLFFPPWLWRAAATLFSTRVFRRAKDAEGYLRQLPRALETVAAVMILLNALAWVLMLHWVWQSAMPTLHQLAEVVQGAFREHFGVVAKSK